MGATQSVQLNGAEILADALDKEVHRKRLAQVKRRGTLRLASAYRTVSPAVMVIVEVIPVVFLAKKRKAVCSREGENLREVVAREERQRTLT